MCDMLDGMSMMMDVKETDVLKDRFEKRAFRGIEFKSSTYQSFKKQWERGQSSGLLNSVLLAGYTFEGSKQYFRAKLLEQGEDIWQVYTVHVS
jgi:hypothetical protein